MKRSIVCIIFFFSHYGSVPLYGQGLFTSDGQNGALISADAVTQNGTFGAGGTAGYSFGNFADIRFSTTHFWLGEKLGGENISANQFTPSISIYGTGGSPICAMVRASYSLARYSSPALDTLHGTLNGNFASILLAVYTRIPASPSVVLYPAIGLEYIEGTHNDDIGLYPSVSSSFTRTPLILQLPISYSLPSGSMLVIEPSFRLFPQLAIEPSFSEFRISAGFIIPTGALF